MNRRKAINNIVLATGGLITLPQWMVSCGISETNSHSTSFSISEQKTLASIADTIIPAGNSIGALSVEVDKYLQKLIDDCMEKEVKDNVKIQLKAIETNAEKQHGKSFADCTQKQREDLLLKFTSSENKQEKDFFNLIKSETIRGFNTSQKVMKEYLGYKVAPGHYYGCVNIKS
jgi:hypothetical protein